MSLILRNINFGSAVGASGIEGFFSGDEYDYHKIFSMLHKLYVPGFAGFDFAGMTFCAKTMTLNPRAGNTKLGADNICVKNFRPDSIVAKLFSGIGLNAVGLSNPGAEFLLAAGLWQKRTTPFMLSFMAVGNTSAERLAETKAFAALLAKYLPTFSASVGLQINLSCPNTNHGQDELMHEAYDALNVLGTLGIPLIPKLNVLVSVDTAYQIYQHKDCDALCVSNTIPYGRLTESIDWQKYFGKESPLKKYGGGGLSGKPLFPLLVSWLQRAEAAWQGKNVNVLAGGGILCAEQVERLREFSIVRAVSPGSVAFLRWWRLHSIIKKAHACFW